jgi:hypothetical protein
MWLEAYFNASYTIFRCRCEHLMKMIDRKRTEVVRDHIIKWATDPDACFKASQIGLPAKFFSSVSYLATAASVMKATGHGLTSSGSIIVDAMKNEMRAGAKRRKNIQRLIKKGAECSAYLSADTKKKLVGTPMMVLRSAAKRSEHVALSLKSGTLGQFVDGMKESDAAWNKALSGNIGIKDLTKIPLIGGLSAKTCLQHADLTMYVSFRWAFCMGSKEPESTPVCRSCWNCDGIPRRYHSCW